MKKALILIVEDNAECRDVLAWILEQHSFETISAKSGREAVELAIKCRPGLVLMDLNIPGMDGYEATRAIHADRHTRGIPVVAVSADCADYRYENRALEVGFIAALRKPWEPEELFKVVMKVLAAETTRARNTG